MTISSRAFAEAVAAAKVLAAAPTPVAEPRKGATVLVFKQLSLTEFGNRVPPITQIQYEVEPGVFKTVRVWQGCYLYAQIHEHKERVGENPNWYSYTADFDICVDTEPVMVTKVWLNDEPAPVGSWRMEHRPSLA